MARRRASPASPPPTSPPPTSPQGTPAADPVREPVRGASTSQFAELSRPPTASPPPAPVAVERGVVVFDLDGTILDDLGLISHVAGDVLFRAFGTPADEARIHYLTTTGMPFEAQLAQLYPEATPDERHQVAVLFHQRKIAEAYAHAGPFPEIPKLLKRLSQARWTLVVSTGAETEMADLVLEREGLRYWFEGVLGSGQGTKREHLVEYQRRYPGARLFLVGDSRFDMEAAGSVPGVSAIGRASNLHGWALTPDDLKRWGAAWAGYDLSDLPEALESLSATPTSRKRPSRSAGARKG